MRLTVTGIETIELTDPLDLCQKPAAAVGIQPNPPPIGIPMPPSPRIPRGPWVTPIPNIGDPVNPIPLPTIDWTHRPDYRTAEPSEPEKWGRGLTAAVEDGMDSSHHATSRGKRNGDKDAGRANRL